MTKEVMVLLFWVLILQTDRVVLALLCVIEFVLCLFLVGLTGTIIVLRRYE